MSRPRKYPEELLERAVRLTVESGRPIAHVADVNRAARICAAGHGGEILVSQATRDLIGDGRLQLCQLGGDGISEQSMK